MRYDFIIQLFRDFFDSSLKLIEYFGEKTLPNLNHFFFAKMIKEWHYVLTTNFDYLIEYAIGLDNKKLKIIITKDDFNTYGNPKKNVEEKFLSLYKIHGSILNVKTGEDTQSSIITTLDSLGKEKGENIFSLEPFKFEFFEKACKNRTLIIMGYSGGDDFDIIPTLLRLNHIKRIVWVEHTNDTQCDIKYLQLNQNYKLSNKEIQDLANIDQVLFKLGKKKRIEIIKIIVHTPNLVKKLIGNEFNSLISEDDKRHDIFEWINRNFLQADERLKECFTAEIFFNYNLYEKSLEFFERAYKIDKKRKNDVGIIEDLKNLGNVYKLTGNPEKALKYYEKSFNISKKTNDLIGMAKSLNNLGLIHLELRQFDKALEYFQYAYKTNVKINRKIGMGRNLNNMGHVLKERKKFSEALDSYKKAKHLFETIGDLNEIAFVLGNIGLMEKELKDYDSSIDYLIKSEEILKKIGNYQGQASCLVNLGLVWNEMSSSSSKKKALKFCRAAYALFEESNNILEMINTLVNIGNIKSDMEQASAAMKSYKKAKSLLKTLTKTSENENFIKKYEKFIEESIYNAKSSSSQFKSLL